MLALHDMTLPQAIQTATVAYQVPVSRVLDVLRTVSQKPSGVGPMGIPAPWFPVLAKAGFPLWKVETMPQWNIAAGTWILAQETASQGQSGKRPDGLSVGPSAVWRGYTQPVAHMAQLLDQAAQRSGVPTALLTAVMLQESDGDPEARSDKGAMGLMQLIPATAARYGVTDPWNPAQNLMGGAEYLAHLLRDFHGNPILALAAYNAGPQAVRQYHGIPPYRQTQAYVPAVMTHYMQLVRQSLPMEHNG